MLGFGSHLVLDEIWSIDLHALPPEELVRHGDQVLGRLLVVEPGHVRLMVVLAVLILRRPDLWQPALAGPTRRHARHAIVGRLRR